MRNRYARYACVLGICFLTTACYNNPDVSVRPPGSGDAHFTKGPQVGPGTTAGGSTAGPQPKPQHEKSAAEAEPAAAEHKTEPAAKH